MGTVVYRWGSSEGTMSTPQSRADLNCGLDLEGGLVNDGAHAVLGCFSAATQLPTLLGLSFCCVVLRAGDLSCNSTSPDSHQLNIKGICMFVVLNWRDFVFWVGSQPVV